MAQSSRWTRQFRCGVSEDHLDNYFHAARETRACTPQKTLARTLNSLASVRPHACGDNPMGRPILTPRSGSPPRVWGQPRHLLRCVIARRFTPTRVGTTLRASRLSFPAAVHPHACGDNVDHNVGSVLHDGSPPRVWGQHGRINPLAQEFRFTPTRVGTTRAGWPIHSWPPVHPHACGDN